MIDAVLAEAGLQLARRSTRSPSGAGPGGFTGVRLAASVTQGLAFGADLPVVPVSDLRGGRPAGVRPRRSAVERVLVCNDARMQEVYWACFERGGRACARSLGTEHVSPPQASSLPAAWLDAAPRSSPASAAASGRTRDLGRAVGAALPRCTRRPAAPGAGDRAARGAGAAGGPAPCRPEQALPVYLRDDVAHVPARQLARVTKLTCEAASS